MTETEEYLRLDEAFFSALERGDSATIAQCYGQQMRIWNNAQQVEMTGAEHIAGLEAFFFPRFLNRVYENKRTDLLSDGFVRQQVLSATFDGEPVRIPMCLICRVTEGRISRIDEYLTLSAIPQT
ncbi:ketosteroid isomerase-like protein [Sphingomonas vulcanisoli]|uniref:Ketosteroid isomerase-like protein n=1 Tax=Sphingomonas vulcanisoli TaxID=1658060 RepID=A0ABX0TXU3_9SPHN|nr:ketosteroid isomerase-like protein [Sphingomonas vulcanisoli]